MTFRDNCLNYLTNACNWLERLLQKAVEWDYETQADKPQAQQPIRQGFDTQPTSAFATLSQQLKLTEFEQNILLLCVAWEIKPHFAQLYAKVLNDPQNTYPTFSLALRLFPNRNWDALSSQHSLRYWNLIEIIDVKGTSLINCPLKVNQRILNYVLGSTSLDSQLTSFFLPFSSPSSSKAHFQASPYCSIKLEKFQLREAEEEVRFSPSAPPTSPAPPACLNKQFLLTEPYCLASSQSDISKNILDRLQNKVSPSTFPLINLLGANSTIKQLIASEVCKTLGFSLFRFFIEQLPTQPTELNHLIRLWQRESKLFSLALYLDLQNLEGLASNSDKVTALRRFLLAGTGIFFIDSQESYNGLEGDIISFEVDKPTPEEQYQFWGQILEENSKIIAQQLTSQFNLNLGDIQAIAHRNIQKAYHTLTKDKNNISSDAKQTSQSPPSLFQLLWQDCLDHTRPQMEQLAQRLQLKATWDDIVLPDEIKEQLRQIVAQIRHRYQVYDQWGYRKRLNRGLGLSVVFAGESGTGKTMAAEVIAKELQLNLYRIDLSAVVSKYIGETEKNLRKLFDAAENGGGILFFDEADALFGKRSQVKDSHDRYANIEINYLLQRLESYSGLAILATNKKSSIDNAFMRRLRFIIDFPFPSANMRQQLWEKVFPPNAPVEKLDYDYLRKLSITGGSIHNIALNASFLAAEKNKTITMEEVKSAVRSEFIKLGRSRSLD